MVPTLAVLALALLSAGSSSVDALKVTFKNGCSFPIDLYSREGGATKADPKTPIPVGGTSAIVFGKDFEGHFRHGADDAATLVEFSTKGAMNIVWYDISIIPARLNKGFEFCGSLAECKANSQSKKGFNVPVQMTPMSNTNGGGCRELNCLQDECPDAYLFPKDDEKTHGCDLNTDFTVTFCPSGASNGGGSPSTAPATTRPAPSPTSAVPATTRPAPTSTAPATQAPTTPPPTTKPPAAPSPSPSPTMTPAPSTAQTPTPTPTPSTAEIPTPTPTPSTVQVPTPTPTPTPKPSQPPPPSPAPGPTPGPTPGPSPTPMPTPPPSGTPVPSENGKIKVPDVAKLVVAPALTPATPVAKPSSAPPTPAPVAPTVPGPMPAPPASPKKKIKMCV